MGCTRNAIEWGSNFVADGYDRTIDAIEAGVRPDVEAKYAGEWEACGIIRRLFLLRRIGREIDELIAERSKHISPESHF